MCLVVTGEIMLVVAREALPVGAGEVILVVSVHCSRERIYCYPSIDGLTCCVLPRHFVQPSVQIGPRQIGQTQRKFILLSA